MGQKEMNRGPLAVFSGVLRGPLAANALYVAHGRDDNVAPPAIPGDMMDAPIPGWDNAWIDLGGEG